MSIAIDFQPAGAIHNFIYRCQQPFEKLNSEAAFNQFFQEKIGLSANEIYEFKIFLELRGVVLKNRNILAINYIGGRDIIITKIGREGRRCLIYATEVGQNGDLNTDFYTQLVTLPKNIRFDEYQIIFNQKSPLTEYIRLIEKKDIEFKRNHYRMLGMVDAAPRGKEFKNTINKIYEKNRTAYTTFQAKMAELIEDLQGPDLGTFKPSLCEKLLPQAI